MAQGNVLVLKDRGLEKVERILVPISGGPHAKLGLLVANELAEEWGAKITAYNVQIGKGPSVDSSRFDQESVKLFHGVAKDFVNETITSADINAEVRVDIDTDVSRAIVRAAKEHDLIVMGASNEWTLRRWLFGSLPDQVANQAPVSVLMVRSKT